MSFPIFIKYDSKDKILNGTLVPSSVLHLVYKKNHSRSLYSFLRNNTSSLAVKIYIVHILYSAITQLPVLYVFYSLFLKDKSNDI